MSGAARLAAFAVALVVSLAIGAAIGTAAGPIDVGGDEQHDGPTTTVTLEHDGDHGGFG